MRMSEKCHNNNSTHPGHVYNQNISEKAAFFRSLKAVQNPFIKNGTYSRGLKAVRFLIKSKRFSTVRLAQIIFSHASTCL